MQEHFDTCAICQKQYDMRDLGEALFHGFGQCAIGGTAPKIPYSSSKKVGEAVEFTPNKVKINLN